MLYLWPRDVITLTALKTQLSRYISNAYEISASQNVLSKYQYKIARCVIRRKGEASLTCLRKIETKNVHFPQHNFRYPANDNVLAVEKVNTMTPSDPREWPNDEKSDGREVGPRSKMEWGSVTKSHDFHQFSVQRRTYWRIVLRCFARDHPCVCAWGCVCMRARARERKGGEHTTLNKDVSTSIF